MQVGGVKVLSGRSNRLFLFALALLVGCGAGLGAVAFRHMITGLTQLFSGHVDYSAAGHAANPHVESLGRYFVILAPIVAGLIYGPLVQFFAKEARGHGVPEVMLAVARNGGRIRPQVAVVKSVASAVCIGGGGSVGREGPIVQIGSALGSGLGQLAKLDERTIRLLVACGAAGGIAATFNAPLAGVFFAMELILRRWTTDSFGMVVVSSVTASIIGRAMLGNHPFLHLPTFQVEHVVQYPLFAVLALIAGVVGVLFSRVLYGVEDACDWAWRGPEWARPAVGGILLGLLLLLLPEMYGVGYPVLGNAVADHYTVLFLLVLLVGKLAACSLTIGIGGSGGVFAPSLFCGAMLGAAFGDGVHALIPTVGGSIGAYALVGMGAVFAGAARAPITAAVIMFELTGEYTIILPLMLAVVVATAISSVLSKDTVYTRKLLRRGIDIDEPADATIRRRPITTLMVEPPPAVHPDADLAAVAGMFAGRSDTTLPVVDDDGRYLGTLTSHDVLDALAAGNSTDVVALTTDTQPVEATATFGAVLHQLDSGGDAVPVADDTGALVGWVHLRDVLDALAPANPGSVPFTVPNPPAPVRTGRRDAALSKEG